MQAIAAASSSGGIGTWAYLAAFAAGYMGIPFTGTVAIGTAAILARQGQLNIAAVLKPVAKGEQVCKNWGRAVVPLSRSPARAWHDRPAGTTGVRCSGHGRSRAGIRYESRQEGDGLLASADITDSRHQSKMPYEGDLPGVSRSNIYDIRA